MNLSNALALNAKKTNTVNKTVKTTPDFQLSVDEKSTIITFSDSFMKKADVQNNKLNVYYENADECVYFIFHQGNGVQGESLAIDFFKGKKVSLKDEEGNKVDTDEIGNKTPRFKDAPTVSGETIKELLELQYQYTKDLVFLSANFVEHKESFLDLKITSIWTLDFLGSINKTSEVVSNTEEIVTNAITYSDVKQSDVVQTFESVPLYNTANSTESAINNFETAGQYAENQVSLFDENGELN